MGGTQNSLRTLKAVNPADETSRDFLRAADGKENRIGLEPYQSAKGMVSFDDTPDIVNMSVETYGMKPNLNTPTADEMVSLRDRRRVAQLTPPLMRKLIMVTEKGVGQGFNDWPCRTVRKENLGNLRRSWPCDRGTDEASPHQG